MRPLKLNKRKRKKSRNNIIFPTVKYSNIFQRKKFLIELWQLLIFSSTSIFLIVTFLNQAWSPVSFDQTSITGLSGIEKKDIKKNIIIFFPRNLLELNPKEIESSLKKNLPIKEVTINREIFPPGININIIEREPIAYANKVFSKNIEKGMIDIEGHWIPLKFINESKKNKIKLSIKNWDQTKKNDIIEIIKKRFILHSPIQKIKIDSHQKIIIQTEHFSSVILGSDTNLLVQQFNKLNQLEKSLPNLLINTKVKLVDLTDPSKPELKIKKILNEDK